MTCKACNGTGKCLQCKGTGHFGYPGYGSVDRYKTSSLSATRRAFVQPAVEWGKVNKRSSVSVITGLFGGRYGRFDAVVRDCGCVIAAAVAIRLGWLPRRGSKFLPDAEAVPLVTTAVVNLVIGVCIAMLWVFLRSPESKYILAVLTLAFLVIGLGGLFWTHYLMSRFGYPLPYRNWLGREKPRIKLGAPEVTPEAKDIQRKTNKVTATLLQEANGILTLVFTEASIAETRSKALLSFILFQVGLTLALVCAAILLN